MDPWGITHDTGIDSEGIQIPKVEAGSKYGEGESVLDEEFVRNKNWGL